MFSSVICFTNNNQLNTTLLNYPTIYSICNKHLYLYYEFVASFPEDG